MSTPLERISSSVKEYSLYILIVLIVLGVFFLPHIHFNETKAGYISMGYDNTGKYILIVPDKSTLLDSMTVNGKTVNAAVKRWVPGDGLKIKYIWKSGETYKIFAVLDIGNIKRIVTAPVVRPQIKISTTYGRSTVLLMVHSIGYDRIQMFYTSHLPAMVNFLQYPVVYQTEKGYQEYMGALNTLLGMSHINTNYVTQPTLSSDSILVSANGALPDDMNFLKQIQEGKECNVIYLGIRPGSVVVGPDGSVNTYNRFRETTLSKSPVETSWLKMKTSAYTVTGQQNVVTLVKRQDGLPAVYKTGCMVVFTNTVDSGWKTPEDAAWDTFIGIITDEKFIPPVAQFFPEDNAMSSLVQIPARQGKLFVLGYNSGSLTEIQQIKIEKSQKPFNATIIFLAASIPGGNSAVIRFTLPEGIKAGGLAKVLATSMSTGKSIVTDLGAVKKGVNVFNKEIVLPPGNVLTAVEIAGRLSRAQIVKVPDIVAIAEALPGGGYLVKVSENGMPYSGKISVITPQKGKGTLKIDGKLDITGETFKLYINNYSIPVSYVSSGVSEKKAIPVKIILFALALVVIVSIFLSRKKKTHITHIVFRIPEKTEGARVTASKVINAFSMYNKRMGIKYFPLNLKEVKHAMGVYVLKGILPTDNVTLKLMEKMKLLQTNLKIKESFGFYAPAKWEKDTGQSIEHLAMIRLVYDYALNKGMYARPITQNNFQENPDMILTDRRKVVYVEVLSTKRHQSLEKDMMKYMRKAKRLRKVDKEREYGYLGEIWVVLPEGDYKSYREAVDRGEWEDGAYFKALEREGELRVMSVNHLITS